MFEGSSDAIVEGDGNAQRCVKSSGEALTMERSARSGVKAVSREKGAPGAMPKRW